MAEGRIIKASAFTSDSISKLSDFQFRLWVGLITQADNVGRGDARPAILKGTLFSLREKVRATDIEKGLQALAINGSISLYEVAGKPYYEFPNWKTHQRLRKETSKFPGPDEADDLAATRRNSPQLAAARRNSPPRREVEVEEEEEGKKKGSIARTRTREDEQDDGFTAFWNAYPRKSGDIRQAYLAYDHALSIGVTPEILVEAIKAQTDGASVEDLQYVPSAEKWLRNKGWESKASFKRAKKEEKPKQYTTSADYRPPEPAQSPEALKDLVSRI